MSATETEILIESAGGETPGAGDSSYTVGILFVLWLMCFLVPFVGTVFSWYGTKAVVPMVIGNYTLQGISPAALLAAGAIVCPKVTTLTPCPNISGASIGPVTVVSNGALSCASFAIIALNESGGAKDTLALLDRLRVLYPLSNYTTRVFPSIQGPPSDPTQTPAWINNYLKVQLNALDLVVADIISSKKPNLIHMPESELLTTTFLTGQYSYLDGLNAKQTVAFFNGKSLAQRYPGQRFSVSDVASAVLDSLGTVIRFSDVYTQFDPTILLPKMQVLGLFPAPQNTVVYFINQLNDGRSKEYFTRVTSVLTSNVGGYSWSQVYSANITYSGDSGSGAFSQPDVLQVISQIQGLISRLSLEGAGLLKVVIALNPGASVGAQKAFASAFDGNLSLFNNDQRVSIWGLNFVPSQGMTVGFPVFRGLLPMAAQPTEDLASLDYARAPNVFGGQLGRHDLQLMDAHKYASTCGGITSPLGRPVPYGVTGNSFFFAPNTQTIVAEYLHDDGIIAPGATAPSNLDKGLQTNGLWSNQVAAVPA